MVPSPLRLPDGTADLELSNFFSPLAAVPVSPKLLLKVTTETSVSKRPRSQLSNSSSRAASPSDKRQQQYTPLPGDSGATLAALQLLHRYGPSGRDAALRDPPQMSKAEVD